MPRGSGRRPKPTKLKKLGGNAGKRKPNDAEPAPPLGEPSMPPSLGVLATAEWNAIVPELRAIGVLSKIDGKALAAYCHSFERWVQAECEILGRGLLVEEPILNKDGDEIGRRIKRNPAVSIANEAMKMMKTFLVEFGMTPASRSRLRVEKQPDADPEEAYVRRKMLEASTTSHVN